jgi:hypothetical protein
VCRVAVSVLKSACIAAGRKHVHLLPLSEGVVQAADWACALLGTVPCHHRACNRILSLSTGCTHACSISTTHTLLCPGERLAEAALLHAAGRFGRLHADGTLAALAADFPDVLHSGLATILADRLQVRRNSPHEEVTWQPTLRQVAAS